MVILIALSPTPFFFIKKMGYKPIFEDQKTTLKMESVNNECLASEFDNIFYNAQRINFINSGVIKFYESFDNLSEQELFQIIFQYGFNFL